MAKTAKYVAIIGLYLMLVVIPSLQAGFVEDGAAVCSAPGDQIYPEIISDGAGGAIIAWYDNNYDIYAQRIDAVGNALWVANGVAVCTASDWQYSPQLISDNSGGAIITWTDYRNDNHDIYAQRISDLGHIQWTVDGVAICTETGSQGSPKLSSDGAGGAIITWDDLRGSNWDIYAQRIDANGNVQWAVNGVAVCSAIGSQCNPAIVSDDAGGAIIVWVDEYGFYNIYSQRLDSSGNVLWPVNGVAVCTAEEGQYTPELISDDAGGAIFVWHDGRNGDLDIYAQRIDAIGLSLWTTNGIPICRNPEYQIDVQLNRDRNGGAIIIWRDNRNAVDGDLYAQRVDARGNIQWMVDGVPICTAIGIQHSPQIISDGIQGSIIAWYDNRDGISFNIYVQKIDESGIPQWAFDGVHVCTEPGNQEHSQLAPDGVGGAIIAWQDYRNSNWDIYASRVSGSGDLVATLLQSYAARFEAGSVRISWRLSEVNDGAWFAILRASYPDWRYSEIEDAEIERDGLSFIFTDDSCLPGSTNMYRIDVEADGMQSRTLFETDEITVPAIPLTLCQNYPNPFNPSTAIRFYLPEAGEITLDIFNVAAQRVVRLVEGKMEKGYKEVEWDGRNGSGVACSCGIYFYRLRAGKSSISRKMVLLR